MTDPNAGLISQVNDLTKALNRMMDRLNTTTFNKSGHVFDVESIFKFLEKTGLRLNDYVKLLIVYEGKYRTDKELTRLLTTLPDLQVFDSEKAVLEGKPSPKLMFQSQIDRLINEGWLDSFEVNVKGAITKSFKISKKFTDFYLTKEVAGEEIYNAYKASNIIGNVRQPIRAMDKADFIRGYAKCVGNGETVNANKHIRMRDALEFAKEHGIGFPNMDTFINRFDHWFKLWIEAKEACEETPEEEEKIIVNLRKFDNTGV